MYQSNIASIANIPWLSCNKCFYSNLCLRSLLFDTHSPQVHRFGCVLFAECTPFASLMFIHNDPWGWVVGKVVVFAIATLTMFSIWLFHFCIRLASKTLRKWLAHVIELSWWQYYLVHIEQKAKVHHFSSFPHFTFSPDVFFHFLPIWSP